MGDLVSHKFLYLPTGCFIKNVDMDKYGEYCLGNEDKIYPNNFKLCRLLEIDLKQYPIWCRLNGIIFPVIKEHFEIVEVEDGKI